MSFGQRVLGKTLFEFLLRKTMYSQFVAGETLPAIQDTIKLLRDCGIGTMLCVPNEEDLSTDYENFKDRWGCNIVCLKALANEDTLLPTQMFPHLPCAQHLLRTQKMFLILFRNILCPQQMFPSLRSWEHNIHFVSRAFAHPRNIMSDNVSTTMCSRLPVP